MKLRIALAVLCCAALLPAVARAEVCNVKIVTDASPDYTDMQSLIQSVTAKWPTTEEKLYAMYWWNHIGRRQCTPMGMHGMELTDPIRQFNDYGYTMCSTISGINNSIWANMGFNVHFWDIASHTVPEVEYDGKYHMYDDSMSVLCTTCDGKRIAGVEEIAAEGACELSGGKKEKFHLALYHNMFVTQPGPNGSLTGAESAGRSASGYAACFRNLTTNVWYLNYWDWGHHYSLNVRPNEVYTRNYTRLDSPYPFNHTEPEAFKDDPKYYIAVPLVPGQNPKEVDLEFGARNYRIRGTGVWDYKPSLTATDIKEIHSLSNVTLAKPAGLMPEKAGQSAEAVFRVQSANVTTSQEITATFARKSNDEAKISLSIDNGLHWTEMWTASATGDVTAKLEPIKEVNGAYEVLVKVQMTAKAAPQDIVLNSISVRTYTQINGKTQPRLNIGKNVVYVAAGDQTESTVIWPDLTGQKYKDIAVTAKNLKTDKDFCGYGPVIFPDNAEEEGVLTYRLTAPRDIVSVTFGGRYRNLEDSDKGKIVLQYSLDDGKTWQDAWQLVGKPCPRAKGKFGSPTDEIHYTTVPIPAGNKNVLVKYSLNKFGLYGLRAEAFYKAGDTTFKPLEVTYVWNERQADYSLVKRSHTQLVEKLPFKYEINVGGADHPEMVSLSVNQKGSSPVAATQPVKYGYSDGVENKDAKKYVGTWTTWGQNLALGKKYTIDKPCSDMGGSVDPKFTRLTDGIYGAPSNYGWEISAGFSGQNPNIDLDLGEVKECAALGVNLHAQEGFTGEMAKENQIEVLVSDDNKTFKSLGLISLKPRYKDIPYNFMLNDSEIMGGGKFFVIPPKPVKARYVRFKYTQLLNHLGFIDELFVMDAVKTTPFDIRIALPDEMPPAK